MTQIKFTEIDHEQKKEIYSIYFSLYLLHKEKKLEAKKEVSIAAVKQSTNCQITIDISLLYNCIVNNLSFKASLIRLKIKCIDD